MIIVRIIALCLGVIGTVLIFNNSPKYSSTMTIYQRNEIDSVKQKDQKKYNQTQIGLACLIIAFIVELIDIVI
jgi:predicted histidine transporter YuiF (NhaC family)